MSKKTCSKCSRPLLAKGLCRNHYQQARYSMKAKASHKVSVQKRKTSQRLPGNQSPLGSFVVAVFRGLLK